MKGCKVILGLVLVGWVCLAPTAPAADRGEPHSLLEREVYIPDIATFLNIGGARPAGCS